MRGGRKKEEGEKEKKKKIRNKKIFKKNCLDLLIRSYYVFYLGSAIYMLIVSSCMSFISISDY